MQLGVSHVLWEACHGAKHRPWSTVVQTKAEKQTEVRERVLKKHPMEMGVCGGRSRMLGEGAVVYEFMSPLEGKAGMRTGKIFTGAMLRMENNTDRGRSRGHREQES